MADIVFNYDEMNGAVNAIHGFADEYAKAANTLNTSFKSAVSNWEGDSHDAMVGLMDNGVMEYTHETVPKLINALADLLAENIEHMRSADEEIAGNIPQTLN